MCCSLAFNNKGLIGSIKDKSFKDLWLSNEKEDLFKNFDAQKTCNCHCLYEYKNKFINQLIEKPLHINYI
jgi:hypothetical protein